MNVRKGMVFAVLAILAISAASVAGQARSGAEGLLHRVTHVVQVTVDRVVMAVDRVLHREGDPAGEPTRDGEFTWTGRLAEGDVLEIKGVNGDIVAVPGAGGSVQVTALLHSRRGDVSEVRVDVVEHGQGVTLCAVYPTPDGEEENVCAPGDEGRMNVRRSDVVVDFRVEVPAGVRFTAGSVNGDVRATDLGADVAVVTVNGDIEVSTLGFAEATTVNGSIRAAMGSAAFRDGVRFETVNGSIELDLPDDVDAEVDAHWVNGGFEAEIPFRVQGVSSRHSAQGFLGEGGPRLALSTVNGSIRIR